MQPFERRLDEVRADDRLVATGDQHLGAQLAHHPVGRELGLDEAVLVAADRVEVREVREQRAEQVADERDPVLGQPHDAAVDRLAHRGEQLDAQPVDGEAEAVVEDDVGRRHRLRHRHAGVLLVDALRVGAEHVEPDAGGAHAQALDALVVGLARRVVRLGDVGGAGLA